MAKIFIPRRTDQGKANSNGTAGKTVLAKGEMLISYQNTPATNTNTNNRHNIYFGNGSTTLQNLGPSIYGDTSREPMMYVDDPQVSSATQALELVRAGNTFGQTIGALKKAIQLSQQEQDNWYTAPVNQQIAWFVNNFSSAGARATGYSQITIKGSDPDKYLDLSGILDDYTELYIKATIIDPTYGTEIVLPITIPKNRLYPQSEGYQSFRNGYQINSNNGAMVSFKVTKERVQFDQAWLNGSQVASLRWAFSWKWRQTVPTPS